jgi:hypothetical protein
MALHRHLLMEPLTRLLTPTLQHPVDGARRRDVRLEEPGLDEERLHPEGQHLPTFLPPRLSFLNFISWLPND